MTTLLAGKERLAADAVAQGWQILSVDRFGLAKVVVGVLSRAAQDLCATVENCSPVRSRGPEGSGTCSGSGDRAGSGTRESRSGLHRTDFEAHVGFQVLVPRHGVKWP